MKKAADAADWTGVAPDTSPVAPLDGRTFLVRLQRLSEHAASLTILRAAFAAQHRPWRATSSKS